MLLSKFPKEDESRLLEIWRKFPFAFLGFAGEMLELRLVVTFGLLGIV